LKGEGLKRKKKEEKEDFETNNSSTNIMYSLCGRGCGV